MSALHRCSAVFALVTLAAVQAPALAAPPATSIVTTGCEEHELSGAYPAELFKKLLPPGFKLATLDPTGLIAAVDMSVDHCDSVDGGAGSEDFTAFVEVTPPAEYMSPNIAAYGLMLRLWSTRQQIVDTITAWGFGQQTALAEIVFKPGLDLLGRKISTATVQSGTHKLIASTLYTARKSIYPTGTTRAFALDAFGAIHIIDATWTDQTFQAGVGTFIQLGQQPLPLPLLPLQVYPVIAGDATGYGLTLHSVQ